MTTTGIPITEGSGTASVATELVGGNSFQQVEIYGGGGASVLSVNPDGSINASIKGTVIISGSVMSQGFNSPGSSVTGNPVLIGTIDSNGSVQGLKSGQNLDNTTATGILGIQLISSGGRSLSFQGNNGDGSGTNATPNSANVVPWNMVFNGVQWDRMRGSSAIGVLTTPYAFPNSYVSGVTSLITGLASVQVLAPAAAGQRNYITQLLVTNGAAVGTFVNIYDATNVIYSGYAAGAGGGFSISFPSPLRQSSIAGNLSVASSIQSSIIVSASGYTAP